MRYKAKFISADGLTRVMLIDNLQMFYYLPCFYPLKADEFGDTRHLQTFTRTYQNNGVRGKYVIFTEVKDETIQEKE